MKKSILYIVLLTTLVLIPFSAAYAGDVVIPNTFQSGATAVASEVNENFMAVKSAVDDNNDQIAELKALVATLQNRIEELEGSNVMALEDYVSVEEDDRGPLVEISGVNLQLVNGMGNTDSINGLGNFIVGYDEETELTVNYCSDGSYDNQTDCVNNGEIWDSSFKSGSHYLVLGSQNSYSSYGGLVAGYRSYVRGIFSTVSGGFHNDASGRCSNVSGGLSNSASGSESNVSGGNGNKASGALSNVSGGHYNEAGGHESSISGGERNEADGDISSVNGGYTNEASGENSSVSGGYANNASGRYSSVSGGFGNTASGNYSSILGGSGNTVSTSYGTSP